MADAAADAAVRFLLENIKHILVYYGKLIKNVKHDVENVEKDLRLLRTFIKDSTKNPNKDDATREMLRQIHDIVYEIEDVIDAYVTLQAADRDSKNYIKKFFGDASTELIKVAKRVQSIREDVQRILERKNHVVVVPAERNQPPTQTGQLEEIKVPKVRADNIVGFEDETNTLIKYLKEKTEALDVISIIGLPGLGKTTVAGKIFHDEKIQFEFPTRIWVNVSQEYVKKDVFLSILSYFTRITDHVREKSDKELAQRIGTHLQNSKFLIVMDDVWTAEAWTDLQEAFPKAHQTGKILITSRNEEVARQANRNRDAHKLRFLRPDESWLLFQLEVFGKPECPQDLEVYGKLIVHRCDGLPLAIVVIAGILVKKYFTGDIIVMKNTWRMISESVPTYLKENDSMETVISLSYNKLPDYLRPCFLYLGMFPEDFGIPVWTLIRMWIAEGFIELRTGLTLEQTAQDYLEELISRNLVMAEKVSTDGRIKTCRIHDTLRQFCKNESAPQKGNFFQEIKYVRGGFDPSIADLKTYRRLCVHSCMVDFISKQPSGPRVRSFLCNSREEKIHLPVENVSSIPEAFRLLRILDAKPVTFTKFPRDLTKLVHLRYVVLSSSFTVIPEAISKLWNLQTLVVYTTHRTIDIKANIWNMSQLRHVKTNASAILPKTGKSDEATEKRLQTLGTISPQSCTEEVFKRVSSLKKLGIRGLLVAVLGANGLEKLNELEKLKLVDDLNTGSTSGGKLQRLPEPYKFPPHLKRLTLCNTSLDWIHMSTLGMLESLEVLKLKERAFVGRHWMASAGGFRQLEVLHIERTDLVIWKAEANHFPGLKRLVLRNCEQLEEIPFSLSEINSFQRLELKRSRSAVPSANKIAEAKKLQEKKKSEALQRGEKPDASYGIKFKLYVAPSDE